MMRRRRDDSRSNSNSIFEETDSEDELKRSKNRWEKGDKLPSEPTPPMEWQKKAFLLIVAVLVYIWVPIYIQQFGAGEDIYNHESGVCEYVEGLEHGSEDMETLPSGLTFISAGLEKMYNRSYTTNGAIYLYDLTDTTKRPIQLTLMGDFDLLDFTPHGISVYEHPETGKISVFVVNHDPDGDQIERFTFHKDNHTLVHSRSFYDSRLTTANDVEAINEESFYFTNYLYTTNSILNIMELYMPMTWGSVFYWKEGQRPQLMINKLKQPNGITLSPDQKILYLAHEGEQELHIYKRTEDNKLHLANVFAMNTSVDNFHLSPDARNLWVGSHAVFWKVYKQLSDPDYPAPSQVLKLKLIDGIHVSKVTEIYANDGSQLRGSSVASYFDKKVLIGTVMHKTLLCDLRKISDDQE